MSRPPVHQRLAAALDDALDDIAHIQREAREEGTERIPTWPMLILRTPKGWTGPREVDGVPVENTWRSHQVPITDVRGNDEHVALLEQWMRSYGPEELFDANGRLVRELAGLAPTGDRRMSANPHTNGGALLRELRFPISARMRSRSNRRAHDERGDARARRVPSRRHGQQSRELPSLRTGRDVLEPARRRFRTTARTWEERQEPTDEDLSRDGRVMEILSEHLCQGWLEGYLLTGRHGLFNCYEAFIHIVDSMFNQHAKWLKVTRHIPWRRPIASLNYLLTSHVWRQDHNGFSHQDPGFIDHVVNKKAEIIRVYLPPDANCLLSVADHCLRSRHYVNVIVAGKQPR